MKTINLELSKRLAPYLKDTAYVISDNWTIYTSYEINIIDTEDKNSAMYWKWKSYRIFNNKVHPVCLSSDKHYSKIYKTLTLEEAIEFIAKQTTEFILHYKKSKIIKNSYNYIFREILKDWSWWMCLASWDTYLESVEEMLEFLLDNNLLWKQIILRIKF